MALTPQDVAHKHHFVPQWYQRRFLPGGAGEFWVHDNTPLTEVIGGDGVKRPIAKPKELRRSGTNALFQEEDLYAVQLPFFSPDILERAFFGEIDQKGARANGMLGQWPTTSGFLTSDEGIPKDVEHPTQRMLDLAEYLDAQKTRTPKGLDRIRADLASFGVTNPTNAQVLAYLMQRRQFHSTIWAEAHWEIFSAAGSDVKFLLSDDPVLFFNLDCYPASDACRHPNDPNPFWRGTRLLHPLSNDQLLVLSHAEHMDDPSRGKARQDRRNARAYDQVMVSYTDIVNDRKLGPEQVATVNHAIKTRAKRFVASAYQADLYPDKLVGKPRWSDIDALFQPKYPSSLTKAEITVRYKDGSILHSNAFGERDTVPAWFVRQQEAKRARERK